MFGKFFASAFTGSMMSSGADVFAVWAYVIANTVDSRVELNPRLISVLIGATPERMEKAIEYLCAPDQHSRSKNDDGCRLIREGEFQYRVPNHEKYRSIRDEDGRREYNRLKQQEHRAKSKDVKQLVNDSQSLLPMSAQAEAEAEADKPASLRDVSGKPDVSAPGRKKLSDAAKELLAFLNEKTGRRYPAVDSNIKLIASRLKEYPIEDLRAMVAKKVREWGSDDKMEQYLRPATLFGAQKCAQYIGELNYQGD